MPRLPSARPRSVGSVLASALALVLAGSLAGCARRPGLGRLRKVVLISIDTLRPDHLGCYGGKPAAASPHIDALAAKGFRFTRANAPVPMTLPSHASLLTGTLPPQHGTHDPLGPPLGANSITLAEVARSRGFRTGAYVAAFVLDSQFGLDQGFEVYGDTTPDDAPAATGSERRCGEVAQAGVAWLEQHAREDFLLFLHFYDPHLPYLPPEPFLSRFPADPYRGEVAAADDCVGTVVGALERLGLLDATLVVVTADHGERLGEHGEEAHGYFIYQSTLHVPLVVRVPGLAGGAAIDRPVSLIDVMPTVLAATGLPRPPDTQGVDLTPLLRAPGAAGAAGGGAGPSLVYAETIMPTKFGCSPLLGLVDGGLKYIQSTRPELYDLEQDPGELRNLFEAAPERAAALRARLEQVVITPGPAAAEAGDVDDETKERLESLGYISGRGVGGALTFDASREDAKDFAPYYHGFMRMRALLASGDRPGARTLGESLAAARPGLFEIEQMLARIAFEEGRQDDALTHCRRYLEQVGAAGSGGTARKPAGADLVEVHGMLAGIHLQAGRPAEALAELDALLRIQPDNLEALKQVAEMRARAGDLAGALEAWDGLITYGPADAAVRLNAGLALLHLGRPREAEAHLREAARLRPGWDKAERALAEAERRRGG